MESLTPLNSHSFLLLKYLMIPIIVFLVLCYNYLNMYLTTTIATLPIFRERERARYRQIQTWDHTLGEPGLCLIKKKKNFLWYLAQCLAHRKCSRNICQIELLKHLDISMKIVLEIHTSYHTLQ